MFRSALKHSVAARAVASRSLHALARPAASAAAAAVPRSSVRAALQPGVFAPFHRCMSVRNVLTDDDLRAALEGAGSKLVVVDWSAGWCGPCKAIAPIYEQLAAATPDVVFVKADIDTLQDASVEAGVQSVPTFHFIKNNELVAEFSGADANKLKALVKQHA